MASFISQIVVVLVNRELSEGSVNWPRVRRRNLRQYPIIIPEGFHFQNEVQDNN